MAYIAFLLFMIAPLAILVFNLGREAASMSRGRESGPKVSGIDRREKVTWPSRPAAAPAPAIDAKRSLSPLAAVRRRRDARAHAGRRDYFGDAIVTAAVPRIEAPVATVVAPAPRPVAALPASVAAFAAAPALTPRRAQIIDFPTFTVAPAERELAAASA